MSLASRRVYVPFRPVLGTLLVSSLFVAACSARSRPAADADGDDPAPVAPAADAGVTPQGPVAAQGYPCAVAIVLSDVCRRCHTTELAGKAPFPLDDYDDSQVPYGTRPVFESMKDELLARRMPLPPVTITEEQRATLLEWIDAGAPAGEAPDASCPR